MHASSDWLHGIELHGVAVIAAFLVVAFLVLVEPLLGRAGFHRFLAAVRSGEPDARRRFYRQWTVQSWLLMSVLLILSLTLFGWTPAQLGLRAPHLGMAAASPVLVPLAIGAVLGLTIGMVMARRGVKRVPKRTRPAANPQILQMLPRSAAERRAFAVLAVTAGITEEVVWRGVLLAIAVAAFPGTSLVLLAIAVTLAFGWAHLYQGLSGILATTVLGGLFTALYLLSGSLLPAILLHAGVDLLALLRTPAEPAQRP